jgi:formate hydrogenlyase transcriptional activator
VLGFDVGDLKLSKGSHTQEVATISKSATKGALGDILKETQREQILQALEQCNWVVAGPDGAAARLGMKRSTLHLRMQKLGISRRWG